MCFKLNATYLRTGLTEKFPKAQENPEKTTFQYFHYCSFSKEKILENEIKKIMPKVGVDSKVESKKGKIC